MNSNQTHTESTGEELAPTRASLVARLKDLGDDRSWAEFFETYHRLIYGAVIRRGLPAHDAEDVVCKIIEGIARRMPEFVYDPRKCSFKTWLYRIVEYRLADHLRHKLRRAQRGEMQVGAEVLEGIPDPATREPDGRWEEAWQENLARTALERVRRRANPRYLQIYLYCEMEGHGVQETARHFQTTPNDVSVATHRIREMLRQEGELVIKEQERRETSGG